MRIDTTGNRINEMVPNCDCGLTGGCKKCQPLPSFIGSITDEEAIEMKKKIKDWRERFNEDFERRGKEIKELLKEAYKI